MKERERESKPKQPSSNVNLNGRYECANCINLEWDSQHQTEIPK